MISGASVGDAGKVATILGRSPLCGTVERERTGADAMDRSRLEMDVFTGDQRCFGTAKSRMADESAGCLCFGATWETVVLTTACADQTLLGTGLCWVPDSAGSDSAGYRDVIARYRFQGRFALTSDAVSGVYSNSDTGTRGRCNFQARAGQLELSDDAVVCRCSGSIRGRYHGIDD